MSATVTTFRPPWAITCWVDDEYVYVEMPGETMPYIQRHALSEAGFAKALNVLREVHRQHPLRPIGRSKYPMPTPKVTHPRRGKLPRGEFTPEQRLTALALVKKMGLK